MGVGTFRRQFISCLRPPKHQKTGVLCDASGTPPSVRTREASWSAAVLRRFCGQTTDHPVAPSRTRSHHRPSSFPLSAFRFGPCLPPKAWLITHHSSLVTFVFFDKTNPFSHCENPLNTGLLPNSAPGRQAKTNPFLKDQKSTIPPAPWCGRPRPMPPGFQRAIFMEVVDFID